MTRWINIFFGVVATLLFAAGAAFAQGGGASSTGSISGQVNDTQGGGTARGDGHCHEPRTDRRADGHHQ